MTLIERLRSGSTAPTEYPDIVRVIPASDVMLEAAGRIAELEALVAVLNAQLDAYRRLYDMWGDDDATDAKFAEAYERVRMTDRV